MGRNHHRLTLHLHLARLLLHGGTRFVLDCRRPPRHRPCRLSAHAFRLRARLCRGPSLPGPIIGDLWAGDRAATCKSVFPGVQHRLCGFRNQSPDDCMSIHGWFGRQCSTCCQYLHPSVQLILKANSNSNRSEAVFYLIVSAPKSVAKASRSIA